MLSIKESVEVIKPRGGLSLPYRSHEYALAYSARVESRSDVGVALSVRDIEHVGLKDGCLPWPYVDVTESEVVDLFHHFSDLVSITGVLAPSLNQPIMPFDMAEVVSFKPHYIFDPELGSINLSRKSRSNLASGCRVWKPCDASSPEGWIAFAGLYNELVQRRNLIGGTFDYGSTHFYKLSQLPWMTIFGVRNESGWGAMACGAICGNELHLLHIVVGGNGLTSNASYVLMDEIIRHCVAHNIKLFLGGVPGSGDEGVLRFKVRWSNTTLSSWLLKMVIQPEVYKTLAVPGNSFFPAYRFAN